MDYKDVSNYIYLRYDWISSSIKLSEISERLGEACRKSRGQIRKSKTEFSPAFNVVLTGLEMAGAYEPEQWIRIVTDHEVYGGKTQRSATHNREVLTALEWLITFKYLRSVDDRRIVQQKDSLTKKHLPFAYVLTEKWRSEIANEPISFPCEIARNPLSSYVLLRIKLKAKGKQAERSVTLPITPEHRTAYPKHIRGSEALLSTLDALWKDVPITCRGEQITPIQASMTRIFNNGSFEEGGRFYCAIQNWKKDKRAELRFNGEPTVDIDYSGFHPSILYLLEGKHLNFDPYVIEGFEYKTVKIAFNTLLNRSFEKHGKDPSLALAKNLELTIKEAKRLVSELYAKHQFVSHRFNTGYGLKLQNIDGKIAYEIMHHFVYKLNRPILMVHDSAIVSVRDVESLKILMASCFNEVIKNEMASDQLTNNSYFMPNLLKATSMNFNERLEEAINRSMGDKNINSKEWDELISEEIEHSKQH